MRVIKVMRRDESPVCGIAGFAQEHGGPLTDGRILISV